MSRLARWRDRAWRAWRSLPFRTEPPVCESVEEWVADVPESDYRLLFPPRRVIRNLPRTIEPRVDSQYLDRQEADQNGRYLVRIDDARLVGTSGIVVLPDGCYASESVYNRSVLKGDPDYYAPRRRPTVKKNGTYFSLVVIWSVTQVYYHWMHDTLERLFQVVDLLPDDVQYIVPEQLTEWQRETLRIVGIQDDRLAFFGGGEVWELETLYFAPATTNSGSHRREADEWLRERFLQAYRVAPSRGGRRLFLSRREMGTRRVVNEDEVERCLRERGFETCLPEKLSLREQVESFSQADVVLSTHGSAFTNILFAAPGLVVVDIIPPSMMQLGYVFWAMCEELGHHYWYFLAEDGLRPAHASQPDTTIPMDKLVATLDRIQLD